jgi:CDP-paratose 2-epimerase
MRILITGICGFAGSVIARGLMEHLPDLQITGIDSLIRKGSEINLEPLRALGMDIRVGDIRCRKDLEQLPGVDWVIDCAANPSVLAGVDGSTSAEELLEHNLGGTIQLLEYCRRHGAGFLLLSTSRVYSIPPLENLEVEIVDQAFQPRTTFCPPALSKQGLTEAFSSDPPISLYGSSKRCSELLALEYGSTFGFPVRINRCGVLAGSGQFGKADQGIFSFWIHSWARRRALKYIGFDGMGHQVRDCLHPRDIVPLLIKQIKDPAREVAPIYNVSGGIDSAMSLAQLSNWCRERLGDTVVFSDSRPRPFDIPWMVLDSSACMLAWGWKPQTLVGEILEEIAKAAEASHGWLDLVS